MHRMSEFACKPGSLIWLLLSLLVACCRHVSPSHLLQYKLLEERQASLFPCNGSVQCWWCLSSTHITYFPEQLTFSGWMQVALFICQNVSLRQTKLVLLLRKGHKYCLLLKLNPLYSSCFAHQGARESDEWLTKRHRQGWCAMYGVCADRKDGGSLNCPSNIPAPPAEKEAANIMQTLCPDLWESSGTTHRVHLTVVVCLPVLTQAVARNTHSKWSHSEWVTHKSVCSHYS